MEPLLAAGFYREREVCRWKASADAFTMACWSWAVGHILVCYRMVWRSVVCSIVCNIV